MFRAEDLRHSRHVAVKVLHPEVTAILGRERFLREIDLVAPLAHPHILPLYDSGEADGLLFHVSPLLEGETLRHRLVRERMLPVDEALRIGGEILDALSYAHSHGVVHRDVKPSNILLAAHHALISDFGVARAIEEGGGSRLTATGIVVGTPAYMSPEQAGGESMDHRSDLYSAACVICEMLCGEAPFASRTAQATMARRLKEDPGSIRTVRPSVPADVDAVLRKGLARLPADRFPTAGEMATALKAAGTKSDIAESASRPPQDKVKVGKLTFWEEMRRRKVWSAGVFYISLSYPAIGLLDDVVWPLISKGDLPKRPLVLLALAGLPIVLLLAWAFEIAPEEGVRKTGAWQTSSGSEGRSWPLLSTSAKVVLALLVAAVAVWYLVVKPILAG